MGRTVDTEDTSDTITDTEENGLICYIISYVLSDNFKFTGITRNMRTKRKCSSEKITDAPKVWCG